MKPTYTMEMGREYWLHCSVYNIVLWIQWNLNTCIVFNVKTKVTRHICLEKNYRLLSLCNVVSM